MESITQAFFSFFKTRTTMTEPEKMLLDPNRILTTDVFLYLLTSWASSVSDPHLVLNRFSVTTISHNKHPESPEHEFLIIETEDQHDHHSRLFILERTMSEQASAMQRDPDPENKPFKAFLGIASTSSDDSHLSSVEEGLSSSTGSLSLADKASLRSLQSADQISESLDKGKDYPAKDQFLGEYFTSLKRFHGQYVRYFKPNNLSLFELALLANTIHDTFPRYSILEHQCYFFAGLICASVEHYFGIQPSKSFNDSENYIIDSHLPNNHGRWKGVKVHTVNPEHVVQAIRNFKKEHTTVISKVF